MSISILSTRLRFSQIKPACFLAALMLSTSGDIFAQAARHAAVAALGRLQPQGGIIHIGAPSTSESLSGSMLSALYVAEGDDVEAGELLAVTKPAVVLQARKQQAEAEHQTALRVAVASQSQADEACVRADVAKREADRRIRLLSQKLASEEETEMAQGQAEATAASCTAAQANALVSEAEIEVAKARVVVADTQLERAYIRAPFSGRILEILAQPGEFIGAEGLLELGRVDRMYAVAEVYETDISRVKIGQSASIRSAALPRALSGKVELIRHKVQKQDVTGTDPAAAKDARIIEVEILLDDPESAASLTHLQVEIIIDA